MKELTIEQKAQRYDETIEKLRDFYRDYDTVSRLIDVKEELANLFPELKENGDERIRKNCIHFLELQKQHHAATFEIEECIDWLEKKGEQKPAWSEEDERYLSYAIHAVEDMLGNNGKNTVTWLKSLKDRYTWKPSDVQMDVLLGEANAWTKGCPKQEILKSLYNDLKKL